MTAALIAPLVAALPAKNVRLRAPVARISWAGPRGVSVQIGGRRGATTRTRRALDAIRGSAAGLGSRKAVCAASLLVEARRNRNHGLRTRGEDFFFVLARPLSAAAPVPVSHSAALLWRDIAAAETVAPCGRRVDVRDGGTSYGRLASLRGLRTRPRAVLRTQLQMCVRGRQGNYCRGCTGKMCR